MSKGEREAKARLTIQRENRDRGWRDMLATPTGREALYELYAVLMSQRDVVRDIEGKASVPDTFRAIGLQAGGNWLANRCMLADHRNWLLLLAENERPLDDGRQQDKQVDAVEEGEEQ